MTQELEATRPSDRDALMTTELVPEQILPKVLSTFGLTATYVFIICWITGSSIMAAGGWTAIPMWILGIVTFLVPAGLAVAELGNLWPGQGGVYIWAFRTMGDKMAFLGGYLSWVPVVLNTASSPAIVLQLVLLAFHAELGLTLSIIIQLVILWAVVGLALAKLAANQKIMNYTFIVYIALTLTIIVSAVIHVLGNGSAQPFSWHDALVPNFVGAGFLYGTVLLYLVGVETPFNMGAEFLSVKRSATKMIAYGSAALILIYLLTTIGTMMVLPVADINPVTGVIGNLGVSGFPGLMEIAAVMLGRHRVRRDDDLSGGLLAPDLRVGPGAPPAAHLHPPQPAHPESGDGHPRPGRAVVADPGRAVLAEQHGQRDDLPAGRPQRGVADLGLLLLHPVGHRPEEVRRSLCQRGLLAHSRRHGRGVDGGGHRCGGDLRGHLLLVRLAVDPRHGSRPSG